jgi:hypothetical protein
MARKGGRYSAETKAKIAEAVAEARKTGSWKDAHGAAQKVGYKGNVDALMQMMARKKAKKPAPAKAKKRGRPAKAPVAAAPALDPVAAQYLCGSIDKAVAELQRLRKLYAK